MGGTVLVWYSVGVTSMGAKVLMLTTVACFVVVVVEVDVVVLCVVTVVGAGVGGAGVGAGVGGAGVGGGAGVAGVKSAKGGAGGATSKPLDMLADTLAHARVALKAPMRSLLGVRKKLAWRSWHHGLSLKVCAR
jgi:hypothetical protein